MSCRCSHTSSRPSGASTSPTTSSSTSATTKGQVYFELELRDAWVWDMYRPARFVSNVHVVTFRDVNIEELKDKEL